jgi:excisionase family DNA binding protein
MNIQDRMSAKEVSEYLGVPLPTIYGWPRQGLGPRRYRMAGRYWYMRQDIDQWVAEESAA